MRIRSVSPRQGLGAWGAPLVLMTAYLFALGLLLLSSLIDFRNSREVERSSANVSRTIEAMEKIRTIGNTIFIAESSQRGFLLTGNTAYLEPYQASQQRLAGRLSDVEQLVSDTADERSSVAQLKELVGRRFAELQAALDAYRDSGPASAVTLFAQGDGVRTTGAIRGLIGTMLAEEARVLGDRRSVAANVYTSALIRALVATVVVGFALTAFYVLMLRYLRQRDAALRAVEANNAVLEQRVVDRTADLSHLARHLLDVREREKRSLARDLHDDFGSYLTAINMDVSRARDKIAAANPEQAAKLDRTLGLLKSAIDLKRGLITELRPSMLDNLGLGAALEQYFEEWSQRVNIPATFDFQGDLTSNDEGCPIAIFRVFQEALGNVVKHSRATRVAAYAYRTGDDIEFEIADDGIGITDADRAKPGTHGLLGIRERVLAYSGRFEILNGEKGGTILRGSMPCRQKPAEPAVVLAISA